MTRSSCMTLAVALALAAGGPLAACASSAECGAQAQSAPPPIAESHLDQSGAAQPAAYGDAQIQAFVAAREQIQQLTPGQTVEQQAANQQRIGEILQQHNLTPGGYNAIDAASHTDQALANRIAAASVGASFTDAQLLGFISASADVDPLNRSLASATSEQRAQIANQIRAALQRHNIDMETYNGIAAQAQSHPQLAARIAQLRSAQTNPPPVQD